MRERAPSVSARLRSGADVDRQVLAGQRQSRQPAPSVAVQSRSAPRPEHAPGADRDWTASARGQHGKLDGPAAPGGKMGPDGRLLGQRSEMPLRIYNTLSREKELFE